MLFSYRRSKCSYR